MIDLIIPTLSQGLLWSLLALGVYITFRVLDFADMTVEGPFPLGAAICVYFLIRDHHPLLALLAAGLLGGVAGIVTGLLHTKLRIPSLLAGILSMIALYSVNLRIMGKANVSLLGKETAFTYMETLGLDYAQSVFIVGLLATVVIGTLIYWFFGTEIGAAIRATGFNPQMIRAQGIDTNVMLLLGLFLSNALTAMAGAFIGMNNGFFDVGMGVGTIVIGLASVIIGEVLFGTRSFKNSLVSVILGSIVYRFVIAIVLQMGMPPNDLKLFTSVLVVIALALPMMRDKVQRRKVG